mmetsp:Transcript_128331/g.357231  ORF Transcript_128331/g.357231 Transcript_128331/m.357231 type:complete len:200 (-) Transcript_128331:26-625(-)
MSSHGIPTMGSLSGTVVRPRPLRLRTGFEGGLPGLRPHQSRQRAVARSSMPARWWWSGKPSRSLCSARNRTSCCLCMLPGAASRESSSRRGRPSRRSWREFPTSWWPRSTARGTNRHAPRTFPGRSIPRSSSSARVRLGPPSSEKSALLRTSCVSRRSTAAGPSSWTRPQHSRLRPSCKAPRGIRDLWVRWHCDARTLL